MGLGMVVVALLVHLRKYLQVPCFLYFFTASLIVIVIILLLWRNLSLGQLESGVNVGSLFGKDYFILQFGIVTFEKI